MASSSINQTFVPSFQATSISSIAFWTLDFQLGLVTPDFCRFKYPMQIVCFVPLFRWKFHQSYTFQFFRLSFFQPRSSSDQGFPYFGAISALNGFWQHRTSHVSQRSSRVFVRHVTLHFPEIVGQRTPAAYVHQVQMRQCLLHRLFTVDRSFHADRFQINLYPQDLYSRLHIRLEEQFFQYYRHVNFILFYASRLCEPRHAYLAVCYNVLRPRTRKAHVIIFQYFVQW